MVGFGASLASPTTALAGFTAAAVAGGVAMAKFGDEFTSTMNRLQAATGSLAAARDVYAQLVSLSQQTGASIAESAGSFSRFSVAAREIGATNSQIIALTRTIQQAGLIAGSSTQETSAAVQQLGQALASGKLQGDELKSILENMPTLAEALARQLGVSIGQLRQMGTDGKLTSEQVFDAILRASVSINQQFDQLTPTMGRAFGILGQSMVAFVGQLDQAVGLSTRIAQAAQVAANALNQARTAVTPRTDGEQAIYDEQQATARRAGLVTELARISGEPGTYATPRRGTLSRAGQETAAQATPLAERQQALREQIAAEDAVLEEARARRAALATQDDEARQAEEATAAARRQAAARTATTTAFNEARDGLDRERKMREEHRTRIEAIDSGLLAGATTEAEATRLRTLANEDLEKGLKSLTEATQGRTAAQEELAQIQRVLLDLERDHARLEAEAVTITNAVRTEAEKFADVQANLNNLIAAGVISQETYNRALRDADPATKAATDAAARSAQAANALESNFVGAFTRAFEAGRNGADSFFTSIKNGMRSLAARSGLATSSALPPPGLAALLWAACSAAALPTPQRPVPPPARQAARAAGSA